MIICNEVLHWAETYDGLPFHAILTDAPYELSFMGSRWDRTGIAFRPDTWKALAQYLLPGAFGLCFASSRGWHRLACAIEDAGLRIHPSLFCWANGSSFPKATRIPDERFDGHRYGGQVLKGSVEPIICFQKPYQGKPVDSITATGAGTLWIDGARIGMSPDDRAMLQAKAHKDANGKNTTPYVYNGGKRRQADPVPAKRWPPNFALVHLPQCEPLGPQQVRGTNIPGPMRGGIGYQGSPRQREKLSYAAPDGSETVQAYRCAEGCPVRELDLQAGERKSGVIHDNGSRSKFGGETYASDTASISMQSFPGGYGDTGAASRFFHVSDWTLDVAEQLANAAPVFYAAKASRGERDAGLNSRNNHPTIKPISLCTWLARLLLPPAAYAPRRLLVPFCGTGSEIVGAMRAGWEDIVGIEQDAGYCAIAEERLVWWQRQEARRTAQQSLFPQAGAAD